MKSLKGFLFFLLLGILSIGCASSYEKDEEPVINTFKAALDKCKANIKDEVACYYASLPSLVEAQYPPELVVRTLKKEFPKALDITTYSYHIVAAAYEYNINTSKESDDFSKELDAGVKCSFTEGVLRSLNSNVPNPQNYEFCEQVASDYKLRQLDGWEEGGE